MKKILLVVFAMFLLLPANSNAGNVTSRYDVTIGGYVKMDLGWQNQNQGPDFASAVRGSLPGNQNRYDEYHSTYWYAGETRLNMLIKGPDAWGAKTGAFIEGDFRGATVGANAGVFGLRHAYMNFNWKQSSLLIGHTWNEWGFIPSFYLLGCADLNPMGRGRRNPQIRYTYKVDKSLSFYVGVFAEYNTVGGDNINTLSQNDNARSLLPHFMGEVTYKTDSYGKIGRFPLQFSLGGFYGKEKKTYRNSPTNTQWRDDDVNSWTVALKGYVPIIPDKKGNKTGSLGFTGAAFMGQNNGLYYTSGPARSYDSALNATDENYYSAAATTNYGGWGQLSYYFTDNVWINGIYGTFSNNFNPNTFRAVGANAIRTNQQMIADILWDINPAIRLGLEYTRIMTGYAAYGAGTAGTDAANNDNLDRSGKIDSVRMGVWYFF